MKLKKYFFGMFACAALCACSNDDSDLSNDKPNVFTGDEAYINVRLMDAGNAMGRATAGNFEQSTTEHDVKTAHFYFYDDSKIYVAEGSAWNDGNATEGTNNNIEFKSKTVVVLKGLKEKKYPKYMVTVLNQPTGFKPGESLAQMEKVLSDNVHTTNDGKTYFTMSTTSYTDTGREQYFVTEITNDNILKEPIENVDETSNAVTVYVERLAAKVTLKISESLTAEKDNIYNITSTVAGEENKGESNVAATDLYIKLLGWKLNATANKSYVVKNISTAWTNDNLGITNWNDATNHRSYWGMSFNYGNTTYSYPSNANDYSETNTYPLTYYSLNNDLKDLNKSDYCAENTNTSEIVSAHFPSAVTSILLKAQICDKDGNEITSYVRYNGVLYKEDAFLEYVLSNLKANNNLNYYYKEDETVKQIDKTFVKLENASDGIVKVVFNNSESTTIYSGQECTTEATEDEISTLNGKLADASNGANGYKGGLMYYNIPIEHLNNVDITTNESGKETIPEAKYGVVRNHHYVVTINKLEKLGKGIFDPYEIIIPNDDDKDTYYVGADINILSWKLVNQNVDL